MQNVRVGPIVNIGIIASLDTLYMIEPFGRNIQCSCYYGSTERKKKYINDRISDSHSGVGPLEKKIIWGRSDTPWHADLESFQLK